MEQEIQDQVQTEIQKDKPQEKKRICKLFIKRKNRFCKFECLDGYDYCHHHAHENVRFLEEEQNSQPKGKQQQQKQGNQEEVKNEIISQSGRIPCPLDPNHNVDVNKLEKHLKKCQAFKQKNNVENNVWFSKGINNKLNLSEEKQLDILGEEKQIGNELDSKKILQNLYNEQAPQLKLLIEKIEKNFLKAVSLYKQMAEVNEMSEEILYNYLLDITEDADQEKIIKKLKTENQSFSDTQKDHRQVCKMVEVLKQQNLWNVEYIYIEFGAGKGLLSHGIAKSLQLPNETELTCEILMDSMKENSMNCKKFLKQKQAENKSTNNNVQQEEEKIQEESQEQKQRQGQNIIEDQQKEKNEQQQSENQTIQQEVLNTDNEQDPHDNQQRKLSQQETNQKEYQACHVLLELESRRNKMDRLHRDNPFYLRYRTNILDFNVNSLHQILSEKNYPYIDKELRTVGVSKHMCGGATDLSINTLLNCENPQKFEGMMIATCCHHRCSIETYTNNDFLLKELDFTVEELDILFNCSSWYVSGQIKEEILKKIEQGDQTEEMQKQEQKQEKSKQSELKQSNEWLNSERKSTIGKMVKRTIDIGRIMNLIKKGKKGRIVKYCDFILSPENFVIIAK